MRERNTERAPLRTPAAPARRLRAWLALALCAALAGAARPARATGRDWVHVRVEGALETGLLAYLERARGAARERGGGLLLEIDTPGGEIELMWRLATALSDARADGVRTACWVNDRALSAGALLAIACERLYMRSRASIGSALPVRLGPGGLEPVSADPAVREKLTSSLRSEFAAMAQETGRPEILAQAMVDPALRVYRVRIDGERRVLSGREWDDALARGLPVEQEELLIAEGQLLNCTGGEAVELGLADGLAESLDEVLEKLDGGALVPLAPLPSEELAGLLYRLWPLFLVLGLALGYVELKLPGFGVPGVLSIVCFGVLLFGRWLVGLADALHVVLVVSGLLLIAVELFVMPGTVWVGLLGGLLALGGLAWSLGVGVRAWSSDYGRSLLLDDALRAAGSLAIASGIAWGLSRALPSSSLYRRFVPDTSDRASADAAPHARGEHARHARPGARGRALTTLRPTGKVVLDEVPMLRYSARADALEILAGARVRVLEVSRSGRLLVAREEERDASGAGEA